MNLLAAQVIIDILTQRMNLAPDQIWLRDQNRLIPTDKGLFIVVGMVDAKVITNITSMTTETVNTISTQHEINEVMMCEYTQIDIFSRSNEAKLRNWQVVAALQSFYSQQQQELNNFKIFRIPTSFVDTSGAEGGSFINRYTITVPCHVWYRLDTLLASPLGDYYDDFTTRVDDATTIGTNKPIVEFEITPSTPAPP
jgi:hypothetical protein